MNKGDPVRSPLFKIMYSFITSGNFIIFKHTDEVPFDYTEEKAVFYEKEVFKLHNTSTCIDWGLPEDTTKITFTIDETKYENVPLSSIDFDGDVCNVQQDFIDGVQGMFENLAPGSGEGGSSYLVYTALLSQSSTNAPTAIILENTLGATPVWTRLGTGDYLITLAGAFPEDKTFYGILDNNDPSQGYQVGMPRSYHNHPDALSVNTNNSGGSATDGVLFKTSIEIRVYP